MKTATIISAFLFFSLTVFAQKNKSQRCYNPKKEPKYHTVIKRYSDIQLGAKTSFLLSNQNKHSDNEYNFISKPKLYLGINFYNNLKDKIDIYFGIQISQNKQGLSFTYKDDHNKFVEKCYGTSNLVRFPVGLSFNVLPNFKINIAPVITYSSYWEVQSTGTYSFADQSAVNSYEYKWYEPDFNNIWFMSADLNGQLKLFKRFYFDVMFSIDFKPSTPLSGEISIKYNDGTQKDYSGKLNPQLFYLGGGISYRIFEKVGSN